MRGFVTRASRPPALVAGLLVSGFPPVGTTHPEHHAPRFAFSRERAGGVSKLVLLRHPVPG